MNNFKFSGTISASKSIFNRLLIVKSYFTEFNILGHSDCDDVVLMSKGFESLMSGCPAECGFSGTTLRFLALRASRMPGKHLLIGHERLFARPQQEITQLLSQLGVNTEWTNNSLSITSNGWKLLVDGLQINATRSSQFASAVILNSWGLKLPLHFNIGRKIVSEGYLKMTIQLMRKLGMRIEDNGSEFFIPANQTLKIKELKVESDASSAFAIAALATVAGEATILDMPSSNLQPDTQFIRILQNMGAHIEFKNNVLRVKRSEALQGLKVNVENTPDLFPILGVLCAMAQSPSQIDGVGHLQFKESSRLEKTKELIEMMGAKMLLGDKSVEITPVPMRDVSSPFVVFKSDHDHRMAMAGEVARYAGFRITTDDVAVVSKSFPEFLALTQLSRSLGANL